MTLITKPFAGCNLEGESIISVVYDDVTLNIDHFEVKGDTKTKLEIFINDPLTDEEIEASPSSNLGESVVQITPLEDWKMVDVAGTIKLPADLKFRAEWVV